jgi:hypothetical protein
MRSRPAPVPAGQLTLDQGQHRHDTLKADVLVAKSDEVVVCVGRAYRRGVRDVLARSAKRPAQLVGDGREIAVQFARRGQARPGRRYSQTSAAKGVASGISRLRPSTPCGRAGTQSAVCFAGSRAGQAQRGDECPTTTDGREDPSAWSHPASGVRASGDRLGDLGLRFLASLHRRLAARQRAPQFRRALEREQLGRDDADRR